MHWMPKKLPTARAQGLLIERIADETVVFDTITTDAHCLSPLAAVVFELCDGHTKVADMAATASERLGDPVDEERVYDALEQLEERKLLAVGPGEDGMSRRDVMRRSALIGAAAVSAPLISSIRATPALAAQSATCGGLRDRTVLCCPCATGNDDGKKECCTTPYTNQCVCSKAESDGFKYCKPSGVGAEGDTFCQNPVNMPCCYACKAYTLPANACDQPLTPRTASTHGNCLNPTSPLPGSATNSCTTPYP